MRDRSRTKGAGMSQSARILELLSDGEWHSTRAILREVPSIVHSRVSDLRKQGHVIEHETTGAGAAGSRYRLVKLAPVLWSDPQHGGASGVGNEPGTGATKIGAGPIGTPGFRGPVEPEAGTLTVEAQAACPAPGEGASASSVPGPVAANPPEAGDQLSFGCAA